VATHSAEYLRRLLSAVEGFERAFEEWMTTQIESDHVGGPGEQVLADVAVAVLDEPSSDIDMLAMTALIGGAPCRWRTGWTTLSGRTHRSAPGCGAKARLAFFTR